jgi:hypothetical protein
MTEINGLPVLLSREQEAFCANVLRAHEGTDPVFIALPESGSREAIAFAVAMLALKSVGLRILVVVPPEKKRFGVSCTIRKISDRIPRSVGRVWRSDRLRIGKCKGECECKECTVIWVTSSGPKPRRGMGFHAIFVERHLSPPVSFVQSVIAPVLLMDGLTVIAIQRDLFSALKTDARIAPQQDPDRVAFIQNFMSDSFAPAAYAPETLAEARLVEEARSATESKEAESVKVAQSLLEPVKEALAVADSARDVRLMTIRMRKKIRKKRKRLTG